MSELVHSIKTDGESKFSQYKFTIDPGEVVAVFDNLELDMSHIVTEELNRIVHSSLVNMIKNINNFGTSKK